MEHGEYATRGALLDLFPMGSEQPYRLDFLMMKSTACVCLTRIPSVRWRRSRPSICCPRTNFLPTKPLLSFSVASGAIPLGKTRRRAHLSAGQQRHSARRDRILAAALFSEPLPPLFSYFPANTLVVNTGSLETSAERFQADTLARFENRGVDPMRPLLPPEALWLRVDELFPSLNAGLASSLKPTICRKKPPIPISVSRNYRIWLSRRSESAAGRAA